MLYQLSYIPSYCYIVKQYFRSARRGRERYLRYEFGGIPSAVPRRGRAEQSRRHCDALLKIPRLSYEAEYRCRRQAVLPLVGVLRTSYFVLLQIGIGWAIEDLNF